MRARDHVHAGGDHRGGVDERGDGRGAFHRVGQPDIERKLRATFRVAPTNSSSAIGGQNAGSPMLETSVAPRRGDVGELERAEVPDEQNMPSRKPKSPMRLTMNAFLPALAGRTCVELEADQQVASRVPRLPTRRTSARSCSPSTRISMANMKRFR